MKIVAIVLMTALCIALFALTAKELLKSTMDGVEWEEATHTVQNGETLWDLSQRYCPKGVDCREWIYVVSEMNGIGEYIYTGDCLTVLKGGDK